MTRWTENDAAQYASGILRDVDSLLRCPPHLFDQHLQSWLLEARDKLDRIMANARKDAA